MNKAEREVHKLAKRFGFKVESGSKHFKIVAPDGEMVAVMPRSASERGGRQKANLEAALKRAAREREEGTWT